MVTGNVTRSLQLRVLVTRHLLKRVVTMIYVHTNPLSESPGVYSPSASFSSKSTAKES